MQKSFTIFFFFYQQPLLRHPLEHCRCAWWMAPHPVKVVLRSCITDLGAPSVTIPGICPMLMSRVVCSAILGQRVHSPVVSLARVKQVFFWTMWNVSEMKRVLRIASTLGSMSIIVNIMKMLRWSADPEVIHS